MSEEEPLVVVVSVYFIVTEYLEVRGNVFSVGSGSSLGTERIAPEEV